MKKKKYVTRKFLLQRVISLCMEINTMETTEGKPQVFFDYSPHVSALNLRVYEHGWKKDESPEGIWLYANKYRFSRKDYTNTIHYLEGLKNG